MLKQSLQQKLLQKLSPQQIQLMKLLQLPTVALEQRIKDELEANPALEEGKEETEEDIATEDVEGNDEDIALEDFIDEDDVATYKLKANNTSPDQEHKAIPFAGGTTFHELLDQQLGLRKLDEHQLAVATYLIGNIDDDGYMRRDLASIVDDIAFGQNIQTTEEELLELLKVIQEFDPPGVGARDLQECLILQLERKEKTILNKIALEVVKTQMEEFSKKHYEKIAKKFEIDDESLKEVIDEILKLNPKPGGSGGDAKKNIQHVIPDFIITNRDGKLELSLNARNVPYLKINKAYAEMQEQYKKGETKSEKDASKFVKQKIDSAKWFIDAIQQRQQTLLFTMQAILDYQYDYFLEGDETELKPMILKDIAERIGLDISTVSRVVNSKYVQTPFGTFLLKSFFSESLSTDSGEEVSTREVKKILEDCIAVEDKKKPLTDDRLAGILKDKGYNIARRTVAKYREQLNIPVARLRKEL